jgi:hypothetical protein
MSCRKSQLAERCVELMRELNLRRCRLRCSH